MIQVIFDGSLLSSMAKPGTQLRGMWMSKGQTSGMMEWWIFRQLYFDAWWIKAERSYPIAWSAAQHPTDVARRRQ